MTTKSRNEDWKIVPESFLNKEGWNMCGYSIGIQCGDGLVQFSHPDRGVVTVQKPDGLLRKKTMVSFVNSEGLQDDASKIPLLVLYAALLYYECLSGNRVGKYELK